jgi:hypothetical protein
VNILEERGRFWWHSEEVPDRHFAPDASVPGLLRISENGTSILELDGFLPNDDHPFSALVVDRGRLIEDRQIQGTLRESNKRVLLTGLYRNGGRLSNDGISYENYIANNCLVGNKPFAAGALPAFCRLEIDLKGLEEWADLGSISVSSNEGEVTATYPRRTDNVYDVDVGEVAIKFDLSHPYPGINVTSASLNESCKLSLSPLTTLSIDGAKELHLIIQDFFILLTDSDFTLDWPTVTLGTSAHYRLYSGRHRSSSLPPRGHECWVRLPQIQQHFGSLLNNWKNKREQLGPGLYLYFGTRRGINLYREHRFVNLIWGIEALHRKKNDAIDAIEKPIHKKIERILDQITNRDDKKWLGKILKRFTDIPLERRIFEVFESLPIDINPRLLQNFATACASRRNEISHYGGERHASSYGDFLSDIDRKSDAISILYHALILQEIGLDAQISNDRLFTAPDSYWKRKILLDNDLFDENKLKTAT